MMMDEMNIVKLNEDGNVQEHLLPLEFNTEIITLLKVMKNERMVILKTETDEVRSDLLSMDGNEPMTLSHINVILNEVMEKKILQSNEMMGITIMVTAEVIAE